MTGHLANNKLNVSTWKKFHRTVRNNEPQLLIRLDEFPRSILVTGCQRSGTTMLSRIIRSSEGIVDFTFSNDDELDAALILSGRVRHIPTGRYCFQTTYLNESYREYFTKDGNHQIIWVLRDPLSVVCSMVYNWRRFALNELFESCGRQMLNGSLRQRYNRYGSISINNTIKACCAYNGKISQLVELTSIFSKENLAIVDYEEMIEDSDGVLELLYNFINHEYRKEYSSIINNKINDKKNKLRKSQIERINSICSSSYYNIKNNYKEYYITNIYNK